jgi:single-strand DNA-binding protein
MNRLQLIGNLGNTPEVSTTRDGSKMVKFNIATNEHWTDKQSGERQERTEWHRIVIFDERLASFAEQYLVKGARVYIEGQVRTHKWRDQSGAERQSTQVELARFNGMLTLLDSKKDDAKVHEKLAVNNSAYGAPNNLELPDLPIFNMGNGVSF